MTNDESEVSASLDETDKISVPPPHLYQFHKIALQIDPHYPLIKGRTRKVSVASI